MSIIKFKNKRRVWIGALCLTLFSLGMMMVHVQINYDAAMREVVRTKAATSTIVVSFPIALFFFLQMNKNFLLSEELQRLVNRDRLTDVATRDFFFSQMDKQPDVYGVSLMVDIDRFKVVNDSYGHIAGDLVIQSVAQALRDNTRSNDIVCRFGGEEFVIFLHEHSVEDGFKAAERLRDSVASILIPFEGKDINVTVSIGGSLKEKIADINSAIKSADLALYRAKTQGRNRTIFEDSQPS